MSDLCVQSIGESQTSFRTIVEKTADAIMVVRENGVICFANPAAEHLLGRASGTLLGEMFGIPLTPYEITEVDLRHEKESRIAEMRVVRAIWDGQSAYVASLHDITERKRAAEAIRFLAHASRLLAGALGYAETIACVAELAIDHMADWCAIDILEEGTRSVRRVAATHCDGAKRTKAQGLLRCWVPRWMLSHGLPQVLATGQAQIHPDVPPPVLDSLIAPEDLPLLQELGCKSVMLIPLIARGRTLGSIMYVSATGARRYGQGDLALAEDLAQRAAVALDNARLYDDAQIAVRRRDEFLAMLAHELRNPLAAIQTSVDLLRRDRAASLHQSKARDVIERQGQHMGRLLDDLLDISRVTRGKIALRRQVIPLASVVQDAVQASRPLIESRNHQLSISLPEELLPVNADPTRLSQVLVNLLNNAAKYTEPGGTIFLEVLATPQHAVIQVRDSGIGIAADDLACIFDLFVQAEHSLHRSEGGLGIGLTLVRTLVEMHGGTVTAQSAGKNQGSEFAITLPIADPTPCEPVQNDRAINGSRRRIVIVEDNADTRDMLQCLLKMEGHDVEVAEDGIRGVETILRYQPDIALVDIGLPGLDGYQVAKRVRSHYQDRCIQLVAVTGYGQAEDAQRALNAGFDRHLVKPVTFEELSLLLETNVNAP